MIDVAIIGAGISGLTAAYELKRQGHQVMVLERQVRSGGNAISENINGFLMEHGPSTVNVAVSEVQELSKSLGLENATVQLSDDVKHRYLVKDGTLSGISTHPLGFLTSNYLSVAGRLRLLAEAFVATDEGAADETINQYFTRRFGTEFASRIIDPLVGGVYAGRSDELSIKSIFPKLVNMERTYGSVSMAVLIRRLQGHVMPAKRLYSWSDGIGSLPKALTGTLSRNIHTGVTVCKVRPTGAGFEIDTVGAGRISARSIVIATQPHVASALLENVSPIAAEATSEIAAPPLAVVFLGYKRAAVDHRLDGLGYLSASGEGRPLTGAQFSSSMFPGRAPKGHVALTGYLSGTRTPEISRMGEKDLINLAEHEFKDLLGVHGRYDVARVRSWPRGLPQYGVGHQSRVEKIGGISQEMPGLFVTGNYLIGPSVGACVSNARDVAERTSSFLKTSSRALDRLPKRA